VTTDAIFELEVHWGSLHHSPRPPSSINGGAGMWSQTPSLFVKVTLRACIASDREELIQMLYLVYHPVAGLVQ